VSIGPNSFLKFLMSVGHHAEAAVVFAATDLFRGP